MLIMGRNITHTTGLSKEIMEKREEAWDGTMGRNYCVMKRTNVDFVSRNRDKCSKLMEEASAQNVVAGAGEKRAGVCGRVVSPKEHPKEVGDLTRQPSG